MCKICVIIFHRYSKNKHVTFPIFKRYLEKRLIILTNPAKLIHVHKIITCFQNNVFDICITK